MLDVLNPEVHRPVSSLHSSVRCFHRSAHAICQYFILRGISRDPRRTIGSAGTPRTMTSSRNWNTSIMSSKTLPTMAFHSPGCLGTPWRDISGRSAFGLAIPGVVIAFMFLGPASHVLFVLTATLPSNASIFGNSGFASFAGDCSAHGWRHRVSNFDHWQLQPLWMQDLICNPYTKRCFFAPPPSTGPMADVGKHTRKRIYPLIREGKARVKGKFVRKLRSDGKNITTRHSMYV